MAYEIILEEGLLANKHEEIWHVEFNNRRANFLGTRNQLLIALARNPDLQKEARVQKPVLRWLNHEIYMPRVERSKLVPAIAYLHHVGFLTEAERDYLGTLFECLAKVKLHTF